MNQIAIDGPAGAGKSTLAKQLAKQLNYLYVDTGAIYRTVGLAVQKKGLDPSDSQSVTAILPEVEIRLEHGEDGNQRMKLDGEDVTERIRQPEISRYASLVSAIPEVRSFLLDLQRSLAETHDVVMDGRDIGTEVLPNANLKIFLTASPEARAKRRYRQLQEKGMEGDYQEVLEQILLRDHQDMTREASPLRQAEDAVALDTTEYDLEGSLTLLLNLVKERFH